MILRVRRWFWGLRGGLKVETHRFPDGGWVRIEYFSPRRPGG